MSFSLFTSFPLDIQAIVLESCPPNDRTCLRLTCKTLYTLVAPEKGPALDDTDTGPLCNHHITNGNWNLRWQHRRECHKISYEAVCKRNLAGGKTTPDMKRKCRTSYGNDHCECYTRHTKLHNRLRSWMPKGLHYCGECSKFTIRKRGHNGRCYHGRPKQRKCEPKYWTHTSRGGAFGRKIWKKWFNNRAMNRLEARLQSERQVADRKGSERYALRQLKSRHVDTTIERDSR